MPRNSWPRAVIFDLDGTLIDSVPDLAGALNTLLQDEYDCPPLPQEQIRVMIGNGVPKLIERGLKAHGKSHDDAVLASLLPKFMKIYLARATLETRPYPGAEQLLKELGAQGVKIGLCTNKPTDVSRQILNDLELAGFFGSVVGGTSGYAAKPDPEPMLACLDELGVTADQAVFVGDSTADVKTARNAGLPVIVMSYGYTAIPADELGGDMVIDRMDQVPGAIQSLAS